MARMTHLTRRGAVYWFRFKLPADLARKPVPEGWPSSLASLVSPGHTPARLNVEITRSLGTTDGKVAKRAAALAGVEAEQLCATARRFLAGEAVTASGGELTPELRAALANDMRALVLAVDEERRKAGLGIEQALLIGPLQDREPGMSGIDLAAYEAAIDAQETELRQALAAAALLYRRRKWRRAFSKRGAYRYPRAPARCET